MTSYLTEPVEQAWSLLHGYFAAAQDPAIVAELAGRLNDALVSEIPDLVTLRPDLDESTRALLAAFFAASQDDPEREIEISGAVLDLARTLAIRTPDLGVLLRAYRVGQRLAWREFTAILARELPDPELRLAAMTFLFERLGAELERVVDASVAVYTAERDQWLGGALARKAELVGALLRGEDLDPDDVTRTLGHRLRPGQWGLVLWQSEPGEASGALARLEGLVRDLAGALAAPRPLTIPEGARTLTAWINLPTDPDPAVVAAVVAAAGSGLHLAAGTVSPGVAGFRSSHRQAVLARRVAQASECPSRVTGYRAVAAVGPFLDDPEALSDLIRTELGALAARDDNAARLRETALAYLRSGCSARDAAAGLGVHKNTVLYRLRGIEDGLGRPLAERTLALEVALELVERLGPGVLP